MAKSNPDKAIEYLDYARHCLTVVKKIPDQASRVIHREMAAEWFKLADQSMPDHADRIVATSHKKASQG